MTRWLLYQLADSAFPTGGFQHSGGLEAAVQLGEVATPGDVAAFVVQALWQAGRGALPFVGAAHADPAGAAAVDALAHAFVTARVQRQASIVQGRAFAATCARSFPGCAPVRDLDRAVREREVQGHLAPVFGACLGALGIERRDALALYLHQTARGVLSAAVRLGRLGPHEAQRRQHELGSVCDEVLEACWERAPGEAAQTAPLLELLAAQQDRLYARLFQS